MQASAVMAGLVPAIHAFLAATVKDVDARDKRGHDASVQCCSLSYGFADVVVVGTADKVDAGPCDDCDD
jgi:hypothetical protein